MYGRGTPARSGPAATRAAGETGCGCGRASVRGRTTCVGPLVGVRGSGTASVDSAWVAALRRRREGALMLDVVADEAEDARETSVLLAPGDRE